MEKMIKLNKSKIAALVEKSGKKISEIAGAACLAYTTAKHIIQEGKDSVDTTSVDKVERLAKALGTSVKAITIGGTFERYPKKAAPAKTGTKSPKELIAKVREKAATKLAESIPKKAAPVKTAAKKSPAPKKIPPEKMGAIKIKTVGTAIVAEPMEIPEAKVPENVLLTEIAKLNERIAKLEKIVLKTSSRKKLVKVE